MTQLKQNLKKKIEGSIKDYPELYHKASGFRNCKSHKVYSNLKYWAQNLSGNSTEFENMNRCLARFLGL